MTGRADKRAAAWPGSVLVLALATAGCGAWHIDPAPRQETTAVADARQVVHTGRCPAGPPAEGVRGVGGGGKDLVPFVPDRLLLCGYRLQDEPGPAKQLPPVQALVTDPTVLARLRTSLNALGTPPKGRVVCPAGRGGTVLEYFTGAGRFVELQESTTGCQTVGDGNHQRWIGTSDVGTTVMGLLRPADKS
ncbi:MAG: hypothetical protein HOU01_15155 [Streptomycetaceae bacterium]|nr:hypothetical protein [Streptomycetaceae bacterium]NUS13506.1 hypothetical protein [Streptomyces sp.]